MLSKEKIDKERRRKIREPSKRGRAKTKKWGSKRGVPRLVGMRIGA